MDAMTLFLNGDRAILPGRAGWLAHYERELVPFAGGKNDKDRDSASQYLKGPRAIGGPWARPRGISKRGAAPAFVTLKLPRPSRSPI